MKDVTIVDSVDKALVSSLEAPSLDPIVLSVANEYLSGESIPDIAANYNVTPDVVSQVLDKKDVKSYIDNIYLNQGFMNRFKRAELINKVIFQKLEEAMETGGAFSKKDLYDWVNMVNTMERDAKPKETGPRVAVQVNNYDRFMQTVMED